MGLSQCFYSFPSQAFELYDFVKTKEGHSMSSQPPDGRHVTDFAEILHTIWDMKKNLRTRR